MLSLYKTYQQLTKRQSWKKLLMYFVYDRTRDEEFIEKLVPKLNIKDVTVEDFKKVLRQQTQATLHNLAFGKPIFEVNIDSQPTTSQHN